MKRQSPMLATRGGFTAKLSYNSSIPAFVKPCNEEIELEADREYIDHNLLHHCLDRSDMKRQIMKLYVSGLIPYETVERLFKRYRLRGC